MIYLVALLCAFSNILMSENISDSFPVGMASKLESNRANANIPK